MDKAGIKENDIILEFANKKIDLLNPLAQMISKKNAGDTVVIKILRNGKEINISITLEETPSNI